MTLHNMINSDTVDKKSIVQLYNLFFSTSINYSKNFHSYMEIYYAAILDLIKHKINDCKVDLRYDYSAIIDNIINKSYSILSTKKERGRESSSG
jgi:hypothetical protein